MMQTAILPTKGVLIRSKLERPPLPARLVARPRLIEPLDEGLNGRATLIDAPPGYGKTTLALQWLSHSGLASAWVALDAADRDPELFLRYVVAALQRHSGNRLQRTRALLEAHVLPPWGHVMDVLVAELAEVRERTLLVLEDYHLVDTPQVNELVARMVETLPPTLHLLVSTRVDPPWPLMRWQTRGWLSQLRARDLCFSVAETEQFFAGAGGPALDPATVELLQSRAEGWIAGLRLAQLSLSAARDPDHWARTLSGTDRQIADYLMEEVLKDQRADVLEFLAASALMERFSAALMDHLLADRGHPSNARQTLSDIERENLFLVALDDRREWFRWHHLFRDLLLDHLNDFTSPAFRSHVDREAGAWFAQQGLVEEALRHWIAAGELDAAAELVGARLHAAIAEDMSCRLLSRWLALFPVDAIQRSLPLRIAEGYVCIVRWDLPGLEQALEGEFGIDVPLSRWAEEGELPNEEVIRERVHEAVTRHFEAKEAQTGPEVMRHFEKALMLNVLDQKWKDHLASMDYLRQGIGLRGYAQKQPMQEYKRESYEMFTSLLDNIKHEVIRILARVQVKAEEDVEAVEARRRQEAPMQFRHDEARAAGAPPPDAVTEDPVPAGPETDPAPRLSPAPAHVDADDPLAGPALVVAGVAGVFANRD